LFIIVGVLKKKYNDEMKSTSFFHELNSFNNGLDFNQIKYKDK